MGYLLILHLNIQAKQYVYVKFMYLTYIIQMYMLYIFLDFEKFKQK